MKKSLIIFLHIGYWFLYLLVYLLILGSMLHNTGSHPWRISDIFNSLLFIMAFVPSVLSFYGFYFGVFRFLKMPIKIFKLCLAGGGVILGSSLFAYGLLVFVVNRFWYSTTEGHVAMLLIMSILGLIHGILASVIRGFITWFEDLKINKELMEKNFEMEMNLIKSKLDPHFLFNTINNIDVLIGKDAVKASDFLNKLSDIMRFMLYETKKEHIPLQKEWTYLEKYIELQKIRSANPSFVEYSIEGNVENVMIAPMTLIPFVENAFKHGEKVKSDKAIVIKLSIENNSIHFECKNKYLPNFKENDEYNGLGNELIYRRLSLLYPNKHTLTQKIENENFSIQLYINNE